MYPAERQSVRAAKMETAESIKGYQNTYYLLNLNTYLIFIVDNETVSLLSTKNGRG